MSPDTPEVVRKFRQDQHLFMKAAFDPVRCRSIGQKLSTHKSYSFGEDDFIWDQDKHGIRKLSLGPFYLQGKLPEVVALEEQAVNLARSMGLASDRWGRETTHKHRNALGFLALPGGGFYMHRDNLLLSELVMMIGVLGEREVTVVPSPHRVVGLPPRTNLPRPCILGAGDVLFLDAFARPWHQTYNATTEVGANLVITDRYSPGTVKYK